MKISTNAGTAVNDIIELIHQEFADRSGDWMIGGRSHITKDLGLDSMDIVRLQVALEDKYGIRFDPESTDFEQVFETPENLARHIELRIAS